MSEGHLSLLSKDGQPSGKLLKSVLIKRKKISKCLGKMKRDKDKKKKGTKLGSLRWRVRETKVRS